MPPEPEIDSVAIVVIGSFNPAILHPLWFSQNGLIREQEGQNAEIQIVHREASIFKTEWFSLQVTKDRFFLAASDPTMHLPARDLALGTFRLLEHTPLTAFGLNRIQEFRIDSEDEWHAIGDQLAPKDKWWDFMIRPGMRSLTIEGKRQKSDSDRIQIHIEPVPREMHGVVIRVNEHYSLEADSYKTVASQHERLANVLTNAWVDFMSYAEQTMQMVSELRNSTPSKCP